MAEPTNRPKWAATDVNLPNTGAANKQQPSTTLQDVGIDFGQVPTAEEENWWKNNVYDWIQYLIDEKIPAVEATVSTTVPRGVVQAYSLSTEPSGWLFCDGRVLDALTPHTDLRTDLINAGFPYGQDGSSNPKIPDLRGEFIRGFDDGRGADPSRVLGSNQKGTLVGGYDDNADSGDVSILEDNAVRDYGSDPVNPSDYPISSPVYAAGTGRTVSGGALSNWYSVTRPRNVAMHYIIKT